MMRKALYLGLGIMSLTRDRAEKAYNELVEKGEMTREEARKFVDDAIKRGEEEKLEVRSMIREEMQNFKQDFSLVSRKEWQELVDKVKDLESKLQ